MHTFKNVIIVLLMGKVATDHAKKTSLLSEKRSGKLQPPFKFKKT